LFLIIHQEKREAKGKKREKKKKKRGGEAEGRECAIRAEHRLAPAREESIVGWEGKEGKRKGK